MQNPKEKNKSIFITEYIPWNDSGKNIAKTLQLVKENKTGCFSPVDVQISKFLCKRYLYTINPDYKYQIMINSRFKEKLLAVGDLEPDKEIIKGIYSHCRIEKLRNLNSISILADVFNEDFYRLMKSIYVTTHPYIILDYKRPNKKYIQRELYIPTLPTEDLAILSTHLNKYFGIDVISTNNLEYTEEYSLKRILIDKDVYKHFATYDADGPLNTIKAATLSLSKDAIKLY